MAILDQIRLKCVELDSKRGYILRKTPIFGGQIFKVRNESEFEAETWARDVYWWWYIHHSHFEPIWTHLRRI